MDTVIVNPNLTCANVNDVSIMWHLHLPEILSHVDVIQDALRRVSTAGVTGKYWRGRNFIGTFLPISAHVFSFHYNLYLCTHLCVNSK